ncbi:uncharacterized protein [Mytilus edulis]|uniref:uncharacterized protein n=1 Tax=Mytilus edulis TaxID=6550 RepID=UPI0039EE1DFC
MATAAKTCGVCELRHITKPSIVWCRECDEGLCTKCKEHHSVSKASQSHSVIHIADNRKIPADKLKITQYCSKHNKKYKMYCQKHEFLCCRKCITESHKECLDFIELGDVIHNVKTSNAMCELEETLVEVAQNLQNIRQHQQVNLKTFIDSRKKIEKEIKTTKKKINKHLDKLQEDLMKELYAIEEKENPKILLLLSSLEQKEKEIADCQRNIMNIKQHATDLQVFLSMKKIEKDVYSKNQFLQSIEEDKNFKQTFLSCKINTSIQKIISDVKSFGEVNIEAKSCDIVLVRKKAKEAQMLVPTIQSRSIENINLTLQKTCDTQGNHTYGCCILSDGRFAFTYYYYCKVTVFNMKGLNDFEVNLPCNAFDVAYISEDNALAVTSGSSVNPLITIIDLEKKQIKKTMSLDSQSYGISWNNNQLIYSGCDKGIRMIDLNDESISDIVRDKMPSDCYTATVMDKIYHTHRETSTVTCYNRQGKIQWIFSNESVLKNPRGIDVDNYGNVFVVGFSSNNLVVISPDGQRHREVLTTDDGLSHPVSLNYSGSKNQLLVANLSGKAHLFNIY